MNVYGKKIYLRAMEPDDMEMYRDMINNPDIEKMLGGGWSFPVSRKEQMLWYDKAVIDKTNLRFTIVIQETQEAVGMVNLVDIDWENGTAFHGIRMNKEKGKGYGTDAVMALMRYAFEKLRLVRLDTTIIEYNVISQKMYQKCGWIIEGKKKKASFRDGKYFDLFLVGVTDEEYYEVKEKLGY
ncbi:MAG: GNAT family N-acetyltransferase [Lachnospiraceae bacterium]|nr:GNAT family N-acetyltransferase [Lachnospiraceae bacterium]